MVGSSWADRSKSRCVDWAADPAETLLGRARVAEHLLDMWRTRPHLNCSSCTQVPVRRSSTIKPSSAPPTYGTATFSLPFGVTASFTAHARTDAAAFAYFSAYVVVRPGVSSVFGHSQSPPTEVRFQTGL